MPFSPNTVAVLLLTAALAAAQRPERGPPPALTDAEGLRLPPGAFARLGSTRFRHPGPVYHAAWSPDGKSLATGAHGCLSVWDADTGRLLRRAERKDVPFDRVAYSPDGKTLYAVCGPTQAGCELLTFDAATLKETASAPFKNLFYVQSTFSADGKRLAVFSEHHPPTAVLIDSAAGKELARVPHPDTAPNSALNREWRNEAFSPDGRRLIVASGGQVRAYDSATGTEEANAFKAHASEARLFPNGDLLTGLGSFAGVERRDTKRDVSVWMGPKISTDVGLEVSADGKRVVALGAGQVVILDGATGQVIGRTPRIDYALYEGFSAAVFRPDGRRLVVTCRDGTVGLWDTTTGAMLPQSSDPLVAPRYPRFADGGRRLIVSQRWSWASWDLANPAHLVPTPPAPKGMTLSADGRFAYRASPGKPNAFVDPKTGETLKELSPPETAETVSSGCFVQFDRYFVGHRMKREGPNAGTIGFGVWDVATGKRLYAPAEKITTWAVSSDGRLMAFWERVGIKDNLVMTELATGRALWRRNEVNPWDGFVFAPGGHRGLARQYTYSTDPDNARDYRSLTAAPFVVIDPETGEELLQGAGPPLPAPIRGFRGARFLPDYRPNAIAPDGQSLAEAGPDGVIRVWELATDQERTRFTHAGPVHGLAYHPDGRTLAGASNVDSVLLWDLTGLRTAADKPSPETLQQAWADLGTRDATVGFRAMRTLAAGGADGLRRLEEGIAATPSLAPAAVAQLIKDLDAPEYRTREKAADALRAARFDIRARLAAARAAAGPEGKERIDAVLNGPAKYGTTDLRRARAVETATMTGTEDARRLLDRWANGDGLLAEEAKAAAARMDRR